MNKYHTYKILTELGGYGMDCNDLEHMIDTGLYELPRTMSWEIRDTETGEVVYTHYVDDKED